MSIPRILSFAVILSISPRFLEGAGPCEPVAIVYSLAGKASLTSPDPRPLRLFDRLPAGMTVAVSPGSRVALAFLSGLRYELGERSRATVGPQGLISSAGLVRPLPRLPPLPPLSPIAAEDRPGARAGAVRIRAERITGLYPRFGAAVLAGEAVLRFQPVAAATEYSVEVQDLQGNVVFSTRSTSPVNLPAGTLEPGRRYGWTVSTLDRVGPVARGEADFVTLPSHVAEAREALRQAVEAARDDASLALLAEIDRNLGLLAEARQELRAAAQSLPGDKSLAVVLAELERSLEEDAAGRELAVAWALDRQGTLATQQGRLQEAEELLRRALEIRERIAPGSSILAGSLRNLGSVMKLQGDLASSERLLARALVILEYLAPVSLQNADALIEAGKIKEERGSLAGAEELFRRAKAICERIRPESLEMANALRNLGLIAVHRGDPETADFFLSSALAISERLDASGPGTAGNLESLGLQAHERGDHEKAVAYLSRAISLNEKLGNGLLLAKAIQNLGAVVLRQGKGDCIAAEKHFQRALAIRQKLYPDSLHLAASLRSLAYLHLKCGDLRQAEAQYRQALALYERLAPEGLHQAMVLHDIGWIHHLLGRPVSAAEILCRANELFEAQREGSGRGVPNKMVFADCLFAQIEIGRAAEAFHTLEQGRARMFLEQLAERDVLFSTDLPDELIRRKRQLAQEVESAQGALARLSSTGSAAEAERLVGQLHKARDRQRALTAEIRKTSPRFVSLQYPESLDLAGARRALDPGTVLLSYAVGEEESHLFVVQPPEAQGPGFSVFSLPAHEEALRDAVQLFRSLLQKKDGDRSHMISQAARLYDLLIAPAEAQIAGAKRILISTDGPLHTLPFAALVRKGRYLIEWKPIHIVLSATVYAELKKARRASGSLAEIHLVGFGDPIYPPLPKDRETAQAATLEILTAVRRGLSLDPIPATRKEVESIASLYPRARVYLGADATEDQARSIGPEARLVHFATHGLLNERFPLDSALALTIPERPEEGQGNGLLQAWEIIENIRLDADLVTLSACDTALGQELGGEGLIGLTRAFQYAGARSVLASLWSVSDVSTADLMKRFYGYLWEGRSKDEALRGAQADLIRSQDFAHPYYWAAFQLTGDWK